ncbi:dol-P-Man:Man(7)GlcNAc(2)-PP-Dol alpha-1,6-mannosyltransferase-like isoform X1 [Physella acuta]|uniref:dol-P-Man:Man(7)GlcNAc(2)-PP-Dol alpha-1,6-mannosyltransferase-like isoform X1 n=1 Tax=Physella acuta TaxID=109671 RepID=UPI0027DD3F03|nr:dol-P-Man:Man(7)GlcNAc(2)-PP-Dol alpha-1,6-mannosyltransferase-like isoform X1 [Physella acuta]
MIKPLEACVIIAMLLHLFICPYTKVEESFNMQAIHDVINYGFEIEKYDHLEFPGVVPRSFLGPLVVAALSSPFVLLTNVTGASKVAQQYIARGTIGLATALSFIVFCRAIDSVFGRSIKNWLILITMTQFHFMFYISRPLPNVFALIFGLTVTVDSYFWQRWLWPEGEVMWFNVILNKSSEWGTSPFLWYFYSVLPRALSATLLLVPVGIYLMRHVTILLWPAFGYILLFSFLPHKELRFIIYTFPIFNTVAACAISTIWHNKNKTITRKLVAMGAMGLLVGNMVMTSGFLYISHHNYPGGQAMKILHELEKDTTDVHVHIDVYTAQTGVTRFTQLRPDWIYNKTEDLPAGGGDMMKYTHLFIGTPDNNKKPLAPYSETHTVIAQVQAYDRLFLDKSSFPPSFRILLTEKIYILKRNAPAA